MTRPIAGPNVDVASLGVNLAPANNDKTPISGTSFATPAVAAFLAQKVDYPEPGASLRLNSLVEKLAIDLGVPGKDPVYGAGYLSVEPAQTVATDITSLH